MSDESTKPVETPVEDTTSTSVETETKVETPTEETKTEETK